MGTKRRILLLSCGSFNPITNMHLRMFELAKDYLHKTGLFEVVGGVISPVNDGYGKKELISAKHRCKMVELALQSNDWVKLDHWESEQDGWIPTLKVLEHHQNNLNPVTNINESISVAKKQKLDIENFVNNNSQEQPWDSSLPVHVMLLCGADFLESFGVPGLWDESDIESIVGKHGLVVVSRNGSNPQQFVYESDLLSRFQNNIHIVTEWIPNEISSTHIRRALRRGHSVKYLVQDSVLHYIKENELYSSNNKYHVSFSDVYDSNFVFLKKVWDDISCENGQETAV